MNYFIWSFILKIEKEKNLFLHRSKIQVVQLFPHARARECSLWMREQVFLSGKLLLVEIRGFLNLLQMKLYVLRLVVPMQRKGWWNQQMVHQTAGEPEHLPMRGACRPPKGCRLGDWAFFWSWTSPFLAGIPSRNWRFKVMSIKGFWENGTLSCKPPKILTEP